MIDPLAVNFLPRGLIRWHGCARVIAASSEFRCINQVIDRIVIEVDSQHIAAAQQACYRAADKISWDGMTLRRDIGWRAIARYSQDN